MKSSHILVVRTSYKRVINVIEQRNPKLFNCLFYFPHFNYIFYHDPRYQSHAGENVVKWTHGKDINPIHEHPKGQTRGLRRFESN